MPVLAAIFAVWPAFPADFHPPAGENYAQVGASGSVLPGGRYIRPLGAQIETGPGPSGLAVSPKGMVATADTGYERFGITVIEPQTKKPWLVHHIWARTPHSTAPEIAEPDWKQVARGIAFDSEKSIWVSEGESGRIRQIDAATGDRKKIVSLNGADRSGSSTGDLVFDSARHLIYVADEANARIAAIDARTGRVLSSIGTGGKPAAIALSPDGSTAWVAASNYVCAIDVQDAANPKIVDHIPAPSPQAVLTTADRVFVSNALDDSVTVISTADRKVLAEIPLTIRSLERYRGFMPAGLAYDPVTKWLLVAATGLNAVGVVDTEKNQPIGLIPAGWMPTRVAIAGDRVFVTNARGRGTGPSPRRVIFELGEVPTLHRGSVTTFIMPTAAELPRQTGTVFAMDGLVPSALDTPKPPAAIRHVVLIVKENRTFDEVLGDIAIAGNGPVLSLARMARFGLHGVAEGGRKRFSVQDAAITPNQHEMARRWAFSDNFYADGETKAEGVFLLEGPWLWDHLKRGGVTFRTFDDGAADTSNASDQARADRFISELDQKYGKDGETLPRFLSIHLPNDRTGEDLRPDGGYPYQASFVEDNDLAVGRILDYLSHSRWWPEMAVFVTETDTQGSIDHIDAHRTLMLAAGPYMKRNYVSHTNSGSSGLMRTIFELLGLPPANLAEATAADLRDIWATQPDFAPFTAIEPDKRIFDAANLIRQ
ncbi:MAG TPA: hypothetical protein VHY84_06840 [Bryobacteraceae bacterium]|nr:hypothetical protein [Bryobacteraceae bacterium]